MACIPGGSFLRGADGGNANERPKAIVELDAYLMDVTEVTVEAFDACVASKLCKPVYTIYSDFSRPKQPKVGVSWFDARDYCSAMKKHLPTEAEWEKAARGTDGRRFPWGDEPITCERAIIMDATGRGCGVKKEGGEPEKGRTAEVGSRPPNPYGLFDMAGHAWEWVNDWYSKSYTACGDACSRKNPRGPCDGADRCAAVSVRVVRGGSWYWEGDRATATYRAFHEPTNHPYHHYGFRCAASLEEASKLR
jgi:sulfatase modifying factor 1